MKNLSLFIVLFAVIALFATSCKKDEPNPTDTIGAADMFVGNYDGPGGTLVIEKLTATKVKITYGPIVLNATASATTGGTILEIKEQSNPNGGFVNGSGVFVGANLVLSLAFYSVSGNPGVPEYLTFTPSVPYEPGDADQFVGTWSSSNYTIAITRISANVVKISPSDGNSYNADVSGRNLAISKQTVEYSQFIMGTGVLNSPVLSLTLTYYDSDGTTVIKTVYPILSKDSK